MDSMLESWLCSCLAGRIAAFLILILSGVSLHAEMKLLRVDPQQTDPAVAMIHGPHIALYDPQVAPAHKLFLFLAGTRARAEGSVTIDSAFARWGYHAIGLDYENNVLAVSCLHSQDSACFDNYREAIVKGTPCSDQISVDKSNSILNRLQKLLAFLAQHDPDGGWEEFVSGGEPVWSRIVIAGHSQGSGHAAYIGKLFRVDRVLMFSGPQDYLGDLDKPAPWQARLSATAPARFFAFLNQNDPYDVHHQIANCRVLMDRSKSGPSKRDASQSDVLRPDPLMVEPGHAIHGDSHILVNNIAKLAHSSTLLPEFENVWEYMATTNIQ
jgi:hypothetical protein